MYCHNQIVGQELIYLVHNAFPALMLAKNVKIVLNALK